MRQCVVSAQSITRHKVNDRVNIFIIIKVFWVDPQLKERSNMKELLFFLFKKYEGTMGKGLCTPEEYLCGE